jgi:GABA(A) receptor-associated protein
MPRSQFHDEHPFEQRKLEASRIREKYPDRIPCIVEKAEKSDIVPIDKKKFLVPNEYLICIFLTLVLRSVNLSMSFERELN